MKGDIKFNGILLPEETNMTRGYIDFEVTERTINKTLVSDFIIIKNMFTLEWENLISGSLLAFFLNTYLLKEDVTLTIENADGTLDIFTCHLTISNSILREITAGDYAFSGFSMTLEEV